MDIKELKGTMSVSDFAEGIAHKKKTLGAVWEDMVACSHCPYTEQCKAICDHIAEEYDVSTYCGQVIDYLLGEITLEDFLKEG